MVSLNSYVDQDMGYVYKCKVIANILFCIRVPDNERHQEQGPMANTNLQI